MVTSACEQSAVHTYETHGIVTSILSATDHNRQAVNGSFQLQLFLSAAMHALVLGPRLKLGS